MNKRLNTVLFFLVASAVHLVIVTVVAAALFTLWMLLVARWVPGPVTLLALILVVVASLILSIPVYGRLLRWFQKTVDVDKYFERVVRAPERRRRR